MPPRPTKARLADRAKVAADPAIWCEYADALGMAQGGSLAGKPRELVDARARAGPRASEGAGDGGQRRVRGAANTLRRCATGARFWRSSLRARARIGELAAAIARVEQLVPPARPTAAAAGKRPDERRRGHATSTSWWSVRGISGLATAFWLQRARRGVEVLEAAPRAGGVIGTRRRDGACTRRDPTARSTRRRSSTSCSMRSASAASALDANAVAATRFIVRDGKLVAAADVARRVPRDARVLARREAAPAARAVHRARARRRRGIDRRLRPPPARQRISRLRGRSVRRPASMRATPSAFRCPAAFPRLHALEQKYGSLIKGQILRRARAQANARDGEEHRGELFVSRRHADAHRRARARGRPRRDRRARRAHRAPATTARGPSPARAAASRSLRRAKAVVLAVPAHEAAKLVRELWRPPRRRGSPRSNTPASRASRPPIAAPTSRHPLAGFGFLVPKKEATRGSSARCSRAACSRAARRRTPCC